MFGEKEDKYKCFKYYLRQCRECDEIFKAFSHNGKRPKTRLCPICKSKLNKERLDLIMKTKNKLKEIRHELPKLVS
jgi:hypothetical protein